MFRIKRQLKYYKVSSTKLRNRIGDTLQLASEEDSAVIITKHGKPAFKLSKIKKEYRMRIEIAQQRKINYFNSYFKELKEDRKDNLWITNK